MRAKVLEPIIFLAILVIAVVVGNAYWSRTNHEVRAAAPQVTRAVDNLPLQQAIFDAAETFGRGKCGSYLLAEKIGRQALKDGVPASLLAAIAQTESNCNSLAISNKGAVGLMQIRVSAWNKTVDFARVTLFDEEQNLATGSAILKGLIKSRGSIRGAVLGYNCNDVEYADQVLKLAAIR